MAYLIKRSKNGRTYVYQAESIWLNGKSRQRYLGKSSDSSVVKAYKENIVFRENIGPIVLAEIRRAELRWPEEWLLEAIKEAAINNKLSWGYIVSICNRYQREGFSPPRREIVEGMKQGILPETTKHNWKVKRSGLEEPDEDLEKDKTPQCLLCPRCGKEVGNAGALGNHLKWRHDVKNEVL